MEKDIILLKVGGSALTDKKSPKMEIDMERLAKIANSLKLVYDMGKKLIVVTGVGIHGHKPVLKYNIHKGWQKKENQLVGLVEAQYQVNLLRNYFLKALLSVQLPVFQLYASSIIQNHNRSIENIYINNLKAFFNLGLIPIISGDVVPDKELGFSVCSGDDILFELARIFDLKTVFFGMDVDGIYKKYPPASMSDLSPVLTVESAVQILKSLENNDASGSIRGKVKKSIDALEKNVVSKVVFFNILKEEYLNELVKGNSDVPKTLLIK